ncbi:hypothetical protein BGZ46_006730, partial [Entomortierella lignicola]
MMTTPSSQHSQQRTPHVLIVGAGLAGLLLGQLLDRQGVSYEIFERSASVKPLGSMMSLTPNILPALEQLGLYEELKTLSRRSNGMSLYKAHPDRVERMQEILENDEELGYEHLLFSRSTLYQIFLRRIAPEKIHYNKKVVDVTQDDTSATITCSDGTSYKGDIVVGADGTYSTVRQIFYKQLDSEKALPIADTEAINKGYICLVGTTNPMDPERYTFLKEEGTMFHLIIGDHTRYVWSAVALPDNRISWHAILHLTEHQEDDIQNIEWGPGETEKMINDVKDFLMPFGGTLGHLIEATPKEGISRAFVEDKVFKTWSNKRIVLIGDACHKLLPSAAQGAVNAMEDAVILANCIYDLESLSTDDISAAMSAYYDQRYVHVVEQYNATVVAAKIISGQHLFDRVSRHVMLHCLPRSAVDKKLAKKHGYRPQ